jgi:PRTRC genetic system ParB family protein
LTADGALGVGSAQYLSCKGCQSFGCAVSAMPGSYGQLTESLCFDAVCNANKVAVQRKAQRKMPQSIVTAPGSDKGVGQGGAAAPGKPASKILSDKPKPSNQPSQRVIAHRVDQWRKWVANGLMMQPERNQRALIALALSSRTGDCRSIEYGAVLTKIIGTKKGDTHSFADALQSADKLSTDFLTRLVQAVTASAAFGIDEANLVILLNYLHIDEANQFQIDKEFLNLFTMNELESLAEEIGLRKAMGERFATVRSGKKDAFIAALLSVKKFSYRGAVPAVMRYPRKPIPMAAKEAEAIETPHAHGSESNPTPDDTGSGEQELAAA